MRTKTEQGRQSPLRRLLGSRDSLPHSDEIRRLEERRKNIHEATEQWLSLLREMEAQGQSGHADYERYYAAYMDAKKQLKEIDLALFNVRTSGAR